MPKKIGTILVDIIPEQHVWKLKLFNNWEHIIGNLKQKVRIEKITHNTITLGVCHPAWSQELTFLSPLLKQKINAVLKEDKIKKIHFRTVPFTKKQLRKKEPIKTKQPHIEHSLTITEHSTLHSMNNPELAQALQHFYLRCKKRIFYD